MIGKQPGENWLKSFWKNPLKVALSMRIAHLLASPFVGGPERQVLGLASAMRESYESIFLTFAEGGRAGPFLDRVRAAGFTGVELRENWPRYFRAAREIANELVRSQAMILCTSGYKPDIIGLRAARLAGVPAVAIAHGWTGATWKVRLNESMDLWKMRKFDTVVGVSQAQSKKLVLAGIAQDKILTIPNAIALDRFTEPIADSRKQLKELFRREPRFVVAAAGRLSPEKGFHVFITAAARVAQEREDVSFVIFGEGPLRGELARLIKRNSLDDRFVLAGFYSNLDAVLPAADLLVISSFTEGLPVVLLEALLAGVPVVATTVGGIPEVIDDGTDGFLVPPGSVEQLVLRIMELLESRPLREQMKIAGPRKIAAEYNTRLQAERYAALFERLSSATSRRVD
jgi:glycosyltransferase involved in cell wall biosynthesis